jgi:D-alanine-D-alanine ligase
MRIGFTYDLRDDYLARGFDEEQAAELDRPETIDGIESALRELGHRVERIGHLEALMERLLRGERWDLVFNIAEGLRGLGREAQVPALLDHWQIPYTFSDPVVLGVALHKALAKRVVRDAGVPTPAFSLVECAADIAGVDLPFPLFAKPLAEGSSKGVSGASRIGSTAELRAVCVALLERFAQPVLVEAYLPGREFTVGILGTGAEAQALGVMEVLLGPQAEQGVYSFHNKECYEDRVSYRLDSGALGERVAGTALAAWRALGCRDAGRIDIRLDDEGLSSFIEVNPLAGLNPVRSDLAIIAYRMGMSYRDLLARILDSALRRVSAGRPEALPRRAAL